MSEPCWSPTSAAIGGPPASAPAAPMGPLESTSVGSTLGGMRSASSTGADQVAVSWASRPVTAALVGSVTCSAPSDNVQATQVSTVPKHSSRLRSGSWALSSAASLVADWLGARRMPCSPARVRQSNTVRRSCQPMAGAMGSPVTRSQTTVDARWLVMPTASTGPAPASTARATSSTAVAISAASNSTRPGNGVLGGIARYWTSDTVASGRTMAARSPLVPTSITRMLIVATVLRGRAGSCRAVRRRCRPSTTGAGSRRSGSTSPSRPGRGGSRRRRSARRRTRRPP